MGRAEPQRLWSRRQGWGFSGVQQGLYPAPASLLSLPSCPFQELDVPRTLPHRCQQPGRTRSCPGKELAEQQPWKVPSEPARKPQACRNICSQLGWGTLLAEQALRGSPSREPFPTECIFLHGFPIRVQDVTSWVGCSGGRGWGSPGVSPLPVPVPVPAPHPAGRALRCGRPPGRASPAGHSAPPRTAPLTRPTLPPAIISQGDK